MFMSAVHKCRFAVSSQAVCCLLSDCYPAGPGDRSPATEIQSGQSPTIPHNPLSCHPILPTIWNTHSTHASHTYTEFFDRYGHMYINHFIS